MWSPPPGTCITCENSRHFATPPMVCPRNDVWEASAEIPYWWHVTTQIWVVLLISDWLCRVGNLIQPIRSTTQIWRVTHHQHGISVLVSQTSFGGETSGSVDKCLLFSQVKTCILANSLFIAEGYISSVGRSSGSIPKAGSILGVLKELRNEGTSYALQTARRIMAVPSLQRVVKK